MPRERSSHDASAIVPNEILSVVSHELRAPLNAIIGFTSLVYEGRAGSLNARQIEYLGDVMSSARHLLRLLDDVLDLSRVESGRIRFVPERVDVAKIAAEVVEALKPAALAASATVAIDVDASCAEAVADGGRLRRVITSTLRATIELGPEEARITLRARQEVAGLRVEVAVADARTTGIAALVERLEAFDGRCWERNTAPALDLVVTRRIVEAQGGQFGSRNQDGTFTLYAQLVASGSGLLPAQTEHQNGQQRG